MVMKMFWKLFFFLIFLKSFFYGFLLRLRIEKYILLRRYVVSFVWFFEMYEMLRKICWDFVDNEFIFIVGNLDKDYRYFIE